MKKFKSLFWIIVLLLVITSALAACLIVSKHNQPEDPVEKDIENIKTVVDMFDDELEKLGVNEEMVNDVIKEIEEYNKETDYVVYFNVKNEANPIINLSVHLPVDQAFFDSVNIGDRVTEDKIGNFEEFSQFLNGWIVTVKDKIVREQ